MLISMWWRDWHRRWVLHLLQEMRPKALKTSVVTSKALNASVITYKALKTKVITCNVVISVCEKGKPP